MQILEGRRVYSEQEFIDGPVGDICKKGAQRLQPIFGEIEKVIGTKLTEFNNTNTGKVENIHIDCLGKQSLYGIGRVVRYKPTNSIFKESGQNIFLQDFRVTLRPSEAPLSPITHAELTFRIEKGLKLVTLDVVSNQRNRKNWLVRTRFDVQDGFLLRARQEAHKGIYFKTSLHGNQAASFSVVRDSQSGRIEGFKVVTGRDKGDGRGILGPKRSFVNINLVAMMVDNICSFKPALEV